MNHDLFLEGKKYISSKLAAEITGYEQDYVGQLCRTKSIQAKRIGRIWFVLEESILKHKKDSKEKMVHVIESVSGRKKRLSEIVPENKIKSIDYKSIYIKDNTESNIPGNSRIFIRNMMSFSICLIIVFGTYFSFTNPEMKILSKVLAANVINGTEKVISSVPGIINRDEITVNNNLNKLYTIVKLDLENVRDYIYINYLIVKDTVSNSIDEYSFVANVGASSLFSGSKSITDNMASSVYSAFNKKIEGKKVIASVSDTVAANFARGFFEKMITGIQEYLIGIATRLHKPNNYSDNSATKTKDLSNDDKRVLGIIVSANVVSSDDNEEVKKKIQESFSDEIEVVPDSVGHTGVIRPVFKDKVGQDFIYVLIPVENQDSSSK